ncbi:RDD family protein [Methylomonas sp. ZR1]|uniref:RDD family protein n=1 Tax=unclassified Methylomonas TaxID=2608980 RepID=UPI0014919645|nr:RDD family protein [Methylomonas sp. ZR1]NOV31929.1 RDD family protein [Methylomonas sp. ZR1]
MMNSTLNKPGSFQDYLHIQSADGMDYQLEIAGMGARTYAFVIDWHIRLLLAISWVAICGVAFFNWEELRNVFKPGHPGYTGLVLILPTLLIYFLYHPVLEILMAGRTPGKRMTGVRLVDLQGHTPGIGALLLRNVFRLIDSLPGFYFLGLVAVAFTGKHQRIGDLAAGLVLVYDNVDKTHSLQQISTLTLHSRLSGDDQTLLLDLLKRWDELASERRILFATQFLSRIGRDIPEASDKQTQEQALKRALKSLLSEP